jgi:hypothetical protein
MLIGLLVAAPASTHAQQRPESPEPAHGAVYTELFGNSQIVPIAGFAVGLDVKVLPHTLLRLGAGVVGLAGSPNGSRLVMIDRVFPMSQVWSIEAGGGILTSNEGSAAGGPRSTGGTYMIGIRG